MSRVIVKVSGGADLIKIDNKGHLVTILRCNNSEPGIGQDHITCDSPKMVMMRLSIDILTIRAKIKSPGT